MQIIKNSNFYAVLVLLQLLLGCGTLPPFVFSQASRGWLKPQKSFLQSTTLTTVEIVFFLAIFSARSPIGSHSAASLMYTNNNKNLLD